MINIENIFRQLNEMEPRLVKEYISAPSKQKQMLKVAKMKKCFILTFIRCGVRSAELVIGV